MSAGALGRILVVRYSALGDVVLATAVLRALRAAHPAAEIDALTQAPYVGLLAPWCTRVHALDRGVGRVGELARLGPELRAGAYDAVLDLQGKVTARLLAAWTGGARHGPPARAAIAGAGAGAPLHALERYRAAAAALVGPGALPAPRVVPPGGRAAARAHLDRIAPPGDGPALVVLPGARHAPKRWGAARFGALAALLAVRLDARVTIAGGPMDAREVAEAAATARAALAAAPSAPLPAARLTPHDVTELLLLVGGADAAIAGDTGALHLAAAAGTPCVGLFGPTDPRAWAPPGAAISWRRPACAPCSTHGQRACSEPRRHCLDDLAPEEALEALRPLLAAGARAEEP